MILDSLGKTWRHVPQSSCFFTDAGFSSGQGSKVDDYKKRSLGSEEGIKCEVKTREKGKTLSKKNEGNDLLKVIGGTKVIGEAKVRRDTDDELSLTAVLSQYL